MRTVDMLPTDEAAQPVTRWHTLPTRAEAEADRTASVESSNTYAILV